jgi:hypothetical protein
MFSPQMIKNNQNIIQDKIDILIKGLEAHEREGRPVDILAAFHSFTLNVITTHCFGAAWGALDHPEFCAPFLEAKEGQMSVIWTFKWFPLLQKLLYSLPKWAAPADMRALLTLMEKLNFQIDDLLTNHSAETKANTQSVFSYLVINDLVNRPDVTPTPPRQYLMDEALALVFAGTDCHQYSHRWCISYPFYAKSTKEACE